MKTNPTGRTADTAINLRDGRRLAILEVGKSEGFPIFHFHGNGSSRLEVLTVQAVAERLGVRLICLDRPGIGGSDERRGYRLLDWPDDVVEVADQLGIERFAVEGFSGDLESAEHYTRTEQRAVKQTRVLERDMMTNTTRRTGKELS